MLILVLESHQMLLLLSKLLLESQKLSLQGGIGTGSRQGRTSRGASCAR